MRWPRSFTEELRTQADIVRIVGDYVALKKRGTNWQACCPFHQEKTPSFNVNPARQLFKCFGCGKAGDVFRFVMELEGISFPDAIRTVAEKCGVPLPEVAESQESEERDRLRDDLLRMNTWATEFFDIQLRETDEGRRALTYLEARGIEPETQRQFRLGYAPASWDGLTNYLRERGASKTQIERSGLVTLRDSGTGFYDRFRGRLMFPISDAQGRIVAFGGRIIGEGEPKYLNSPETALYTKGQHLFGLSESRDEIRRRGYAILVEGYLDFLIPYQAGVKHLVASLGTALTEQQVRLLGRYARKVIVNFDPDSAGVNATKRSLETLLNEGFKVNVLTLPDNLDPDEYIRDRGPVEYVKLLKGTQSFLDYIVEQAIRGHDQSTPTGKVETINAILPYLKLVKERIERAEHIERIADRLKIEGRLIREEFKRAVENRQEKVSPRVSMAMTAVKPAERRLLEVLLNQTAVRRRLINEMSEEDYSGLRTAELFRLIFDFERRGEEPTFSALSEALGDEELAQDLLPSILVSDGTDETSQEELLLREAIGTLFNLRCGQIEERRKALKFEINEAYRTNDTTRVDELSMQVARLAQRERELSRWSADTAIANTGNK
jgi:DNA primase